MYYKTEIQCNLWFAESPLFYLYILLERSPRRYQSKFYVPYCTLRSGINKLPNVAAIIALIA